MIEFQILTFIFVALAISFSLTLVILFIRHYLSKQRQIKIMARFNEIKGVKFNVRQKLINSLSEFNSQIDVICEYSIFFEKEYFYALKQMQNDLANLSKLNSNLIFKKSKILEIMITKNFLIMEKSLAKHDAVIVATTDSFRAISKIAVFYQKIVKDIIISFEEHISIKHHGSIVSQFLDEISASLIVIEKNKLANDVNEISAYSVKASDGIKKLISYLKDVNTILLAESYMDDKISKIEKLIFTYPNFFKSTTGLYNTEKEVMKLKDHCSKITSTYGESAVQQKKPLVSEALNALKKISQNINHRIDSQNIGNNSIEPLLNWINYLNQNEAKIIFFLNNISKIMLTSNPQVQSDLKETIGGIITYVKNIISYQKIFSDNASIKVYGVEKYIKLIRKVLRLINDLKKLLIDFSKSISRISEFAIFVIRLINTYKLTLLKLNGRSLALKSKNQSVYDPIIIIDHLNKLEKHAIYYASNPTRNDEINYQLSEINYKIIEINAMISNDEKLVSYLKKIVIRFNKFYNKPEYDGILEKVMIYYNKGDYYNSVEYLTNKYNKLNKKYNL